MASKIKVDQIEGSSGSTVTIPSGQTFTVTDGLTGSGASLTALNASNIASGSLDNARLSTVSVAKGGTNLTSFTAGDLLYATDSTTLAKLAKGTSEQTLKMNSGATAPEWVTVAAAGNTPIVSAYLTADQSITNVTWTKINFDGEDVDTDNAYDNSTNYRFTVPADKGGKYFFSTTLSPQWGATTTMYLSFRKNGTEIFQDWHYSYSGTGNYARASAQIFDLAVSDYMEVWIYTDIGGGGMTMQGGTDRMTRLNIFKIG